MRSVERVVAVRGRDIVAALTATKTLKKLSPDDGQFWLTSVWFDWRQGEGNVAEVESGIGLFFDFYFATHGNFE